MSVTAMTQDEAVLEVANIIGRDKTSLSADGSTTYENRIKTWLYWSHLTIARLYAFPELDADPVTYTLSTSTNIYTFATLGLNRVRQILGVNYIDGTSSYKIPQKLWRDFEERNPYPTGQSPLQPSEYTLYGKRLELDRVPLTANNIRVRYNKLPSDYTAGSAASAYLDKDDIIVAGAAVHAYISLQEVEDAKYWANVFAARFQTAVGPEIDPGDWEPEGRAFDYNSQRSSMTAASDPFQFFNS